MVMKIKDISVDMLVKTTLGDGKVVRVGGTYPPSVRVNIDSPIPRGVVNLRPVDVLSVRHVAITESRARGGGMQHRAKCNSCPWTSTWQHGELSMADNAARRHEQERN